MKFKTNPGYDCSSAAIFLMVLGTLCCMPQMSAAEAIVSHVGSADPLTEGWTWYESNSVGMTTGVASGATIASWEVADTANNARGYYLGLLDSTTADQLSSEGFRLDVEACVPGVSQALEGAAIASVVMGHQDTFFDIFLGSDASGNALVRLGEMTTAYAVGSGGFHSYSIVYTPEDAEMSLYVDGVFKGTDGGRYFDLSSDTNYVRFGSSHTAQTGSAYYSIVELSAVPEPSVALMLLGIAASLLAWKRPQ